MTSRILLDAVVAQRLASAVFSYKEIYTTMASVCQNWRDILNEPLFFAKVKARTGPYVHWLILLLHKYQKCNE